VENNDPNSDLGDIVKTTDQIKIDTTTEIIDKIKKKKKNKKKKPADGTKEDDGDADSKLNTNVEEKINKYKHLFDFSAMEVSNSRFQDNSAFRVLKNWEEKPWGQT
jgi:hypothetical protein